MWAYVNDVEDDFLMFLLNILQEIERVNRAPRGQPRHTECFTQEWV